MLISTPRHQRWSICFTLNFTILETHSPTSAPNLRSNILKPHVISIRSFSLGALNGTNSTKPMSRRFWQVIDHENTGGVPWHQKISDPHFIPKHWYKYMNRGRAKKRRLSQTSLYGYLAVEGGLHLNGKKDKKSRDYYKIVCKTHVIMRMKGKHQIHDPSNTLSISSWKIRWHLSPNGD